MITRIRKMLDEREAGFTLIELLVVIIIIGILAAVAIPVYLNQRNKGYDAQAKSDLHNLSTQMETFLNDMNYYPTPTTNVATTNTALGADNLSFKASGTTNTFINTTRTPAGAAVTSGTTGTGSYCLRSNSQSGATFTYDSRTGQLTKVTAGSPICP